MSAITSKTVVVNVVLTVEQAKALRDIVDQDIAGDKNRLVSAVLSKGEYNTHAVPLAELVESKTKLRAAVVHAVHNATGTWI